MSSLSLKDRITKYAAGRPYVWVSGGEYERLAMEAGYKASNCSRRLRELMRVEHPVLERMEMRGHVWYRYVGEQSVGSRSETVEVKHIQGKLT